MKKSLMPFEAFKLAIKTMEGKNPGMPGWQIADHFPREGGILIDHGFLVEGPVDTVVPNRSNYDHDFVEAEWNEVTGGYHAQTAPGARAAFGPVLARHSL